MKPSSISTNAITRAAAMLELKIEQDMSSQTEEILDGYLTGGNSHGKQKYVVSVKPILACFIFHLQSVAV